MNAPGTAEHRKARVFVLALPPTLVLLNANGRLHWRVAARRRSAIRDAAAWTARRHKVPALGRARIAFIVHPKTRGRFDPHNWYPSAKAAIDGLVDAGVLPDDDRTHVLEVVAKDGEPVKGGRMDLVVTEVVAESTPS
ncbi:hypothetical protein ACIF6L_34885 [Kitasatospora sp. NPDC086009]|uniref:hypothetical protein n=1 Tax=unclassified Kitasatospora TaxID=2633591 RepID=UPI0037CBE2E2